jgi:hypothetical protein
MRKMLGAALLGLTVAGGAVTASTAQAQPYGYYAPPAGYYDHGYYVAPAPAPIVPAYPAPVYDDPAAAAAASAALGAAIGGYVYAPPVPVDAFGPDPNGMIAPDGHRIKCKLRDNWDSRIDRYVTRRECW